MSETAAERIYRMLREPGARHRKPWIEHLKQRHHSPVKVPQEPKSESSPETPQSSSDK